MPVASVTSARGLPRVRLPGIARTANRPEALFRLGLVALVGLTLVVGLTPSIHGHAIAPAIDLALDTVAALVSLTVTVLMWVRFRERRDPMAMYQASGFLALTVAYMVAVTISLGRDGSPQLLGEPASGQLYVFAVARLQMAALVVVGGTAALERTMPRHPFVVLVIPTLLVGMTVGIGYTVDLGSAVPGLALVSRDATGSSLPVVSPFGAFVQVAIAVLFFEAAFVLRSHARRHQGIGDAYIAVGLVFAGFAEIHWAMFPVGHPGQVSTADLLRLAFFVALLLAIESEARFTLAKLRIANAELAELRQVEVERAGLEERARLARELHDGLAQDLWLAKLRVGQLATLPGLPAGAGALVTETNAAIDAGLAEARQAVMALRLAADESDGFGELMLRYIDDFQDRFGLRVEFTCTGPTNEVAPRTQAEVLRIAQEALVNVRQHAKATVAGVSLDVHDHRLTLKVADNGRGFDPTVVRASSFGLLAMRERSQLIGGELEIQSRPGRGTSVILSAPTERPASERGTEA